MGIGTIGYRVRAPRRWLPDWYWLDSDEWGSWPNVLLNLVLIVVTSPVWIAVAAVWLAGVACVIGTPIYMVVRLVQLIFF